MSNHRPETTSGAASGPLYQVCATPLTSKSGLTRLARGALVNEWVGVGMPFVNVLPEYVAAAASDLARIGSLVGTANAQAAGATTSVLAAGGDEVSEATEA